MAALALALPLLALVSRADPYNQSHFTLLPEHRCTSFPSAVSSPDLTIIDAIYYPPGATVDLANGQASVNTTFLPAFCRLVLNITTNPETGKQAGAEVWLPDAEEWNGRVFGFGNGAWGGGGESLSTSESVKAELMINVVPYGAIALDGLAQGYVAYGTDGGTPHLSPFLLTLTDSASQDTSATCGTAPLPARTTTTASSTSPGAQCT